MINTFIPKLKDIINPKKQFFMQNTNLTSFRSTRALLVLFFYHAINLQAAQIIQF